MGCQIAPQLHSDVSCIRVRFSDVHIESIADVCMAGLPLLTSCRPRAPQRVRVRIRAFPNEHKKMSGMVSQKYVTFSRRMHDIRQESGRLNRFDIYP